MEDLKECLLSTLSSIMADRNKIMAISVLLSLLEYRTWGCMDFSINSVEMFMASIRRKMLSEERNSFDSLMVKVKDCFRQSRCEGIDHSTCIKDIRDAVQIASMNLSREEMKTVVKGRLRSEALKFLSSGKKQEGDIAITFEVMKEDYELGQELVERIINELPVIVINPEFTLEHTTNVNRVVHFVMPKQVVHLLSTNFQGEEKPLEDSISFLLGKMGFSLSTKEIDIPGEGKVKVDLVGERDSASGKTRIWVFTTPSDRECEVNDLRNILNAVVMSRELPNSVFLACGGSEKIAGLAHQIGVRLISKDNSGREILNALLDSIPILREMFDRMKDLSDLIDGLQL